MRAGLAGKVAGEVPARRLDEVRHRGGRGDGRADRLRPLFPRDRGLHAGGDPGFARAHRFDGVQFLEPASIDESLEPGRLADFRRCAEAMGLYLEVGLPSPNPVRRRANSGERSRRGSWPASWNRRSMRWRTWAAVTPGSTSAIATTDSARDTPWNVQVAATLEVIRDLTPRLKERGHPPRDRDPRRPDREELLGLHRTARPRGRRA